MTTSQQTQFLSELAAGHAGPQIPAEKRAYFQTRLRNRLFDFILRKFLEQEKNGLSKAKLARRIGKTPDVVSRLLGAPGNWTIDTVSDLLLGICAEELEAKSTPLLNRQPSNYRPADHLSVKPDWIFERQKTNPGQPPQDALKLPMSDHRSFPPFNKAA